MHSSIRKVALLALALALFVVPLGAFVRISNAGLGCPDWPGCYGKLVGVPDQPGERIEASRAFPNKPVEAGKAWKEMIHRYAAGSLALLVFAVSLLAWRKRRGMALALSGVIVFQALLGMWTVTLLLKPVIVTGHLIGGMSTLALLTWLAISERTGRSHPRPAPGTRGLARLALLATGVQVILGGWVSTNYAGLACYDFPTCQGSWWPPMDFGHAFTLLRELGQTGDGGVLPVTALTAIHWSHRIGALLVFLSVGALTLRLNATTGWRTWAYALATVLVAQISLGIANVLLVLPVALAVAHNFGAAVLLVHVVAVNALLVRNGAR